MPALSPDTLWLASAAVLISALSAVTFRSIAEGRRAVRRFEREIGIYDRAFEIYSRLSGATDRNDRPTIADDLVMVAALHACGGLDDHQYGRAKARIIDGEGRPRLPIEVAGRRSLDHGRRLICRCGAGPESMQPAHRSRHLPSVELW